MPRVRVRVLRTDLILGERNSSINNPIALALARVFSGLRRHVTPEEARIGGYFVTLLPKTRAFLRKWNGPDARSQDFSPFGFVVECPKKLADQAKRQGNRARKKNS